MKLLGMRSNKLPYILLVFINIAVALSIYFYPPMRDTFYYLDQSNPNLLQEYWESYHFGNPRIGQLITNAVSRNIVITLLFGLFLLNSFFVFVFLLVFRRLPNYQSENDSKMFCVIIALFSFLIFVFGEMFYYTPFSGNYTFLMLFHLFFIYVMTEYFLFQKLIFKEKVSNFPLIVFLGLFCGMGNEHVPPILVLVSIIWGLQYVFKNKKLPPISIILYQISVGIGYLLLFFAPANSVKYETVDKKQLGFNLMDYIGGIGNIAKIYRYYNPEMVAVVLFSLFFGVYYYRKNLLEKAEYYRLLSLFVMGLLALFVAAYAPLSGTRLLFFSNTLFLIIFFILFFKIPLIQRHISLVFNGTAFYLLIFFSLSIYITQYGNSKFNQTLSEIELKSKTQKTIYLTQPFDFFQPELGSFNRRFLLDQGTDYIDNNPYKSESQELILRSIYQIDDILIKKKN